MPSLSIERPVRDKYLPFGNGQLLEAEFDEVVATLRSAWVGTGPDVAAFQRAFLDYLGGTYAVALHSCTAALHLAIVAIGLKPREEVIVPTMTFAATANAVIHAGGRPVLADVDRYTMCLDPAEVARRVTRRTRAIIPVHFAGRPCDMDALLELAERHGLRIIEDCAHAIETLHHGRHAGTLGDLGAFGFYVTNNVTYGRGGMVTTTNPAWAARIRALARHGLGADASRRFSDDAFKYDEVIEPGFRCDMIDLQAAMGLHRLRRLEENLVRRQEIWARYSEAFRDLPVWLPPPEEKETRHARHFYTVLLDTDRLRGSRDEVQMALHRQRIGSDIHYRPLHLHRYYRETFGYSRSEFPNAEWISERTLSLPLSSKITENDVEDVIFAFRRTLEHLAR